MRLFKYLKFDDHAQQVFKTSALWASTPDQLNDPFDCRPFLAQNASEEHLQRLLRPQLEAVHGKSSPLVDLHLKGALQRFRVNPRQYIHDLGKRHQDAINQIGLICLSSRWDSVLMWSHYGDGHKGICLEIETDRIAAGIPYYAVCYERERPPLLIGPSWSEFAKRSVLVKSEEWAYEREHRFVLQKTPQSEAPPCAVEIDRRSFVSVTAGAAASDQTVLQLRAMALELNPSMTVLRAHLAPESFQLLRRSA